MLNEGQISREKTYQGCLLVVILVVGICIGIAYPFRNYILYPISIQLIEDTGLTGSRVYVDRQYVMTVTDHGDVLHFRKGWHQIEVRKEGYKPAFLRFHATDSEQGSRTHLRLVTRDKHLLLRIN